MVWEYYLLSKQRVGIDVYLREKLDNIKKILKRNWDCLILIDGKERSGKSTLALTIGTYIDANLSEKNIAIDSSDAVDKIEHLPNGSVLIVDEGSLMFSSKDSLNAEQKKLMKILNIVGQKNMVFIIVAPSYFDFNQQLATQRARFLIHTYTDDQLRRGRYAYWGTDKLKMLYKEGKKNYNSYGFPDADFTGLFDDFHPTWYDSYLEVKKKTLIASLKSDIGEKSNKRLFSLIKQRDILIKTLIDKYKMNRIEIAQLFEINDCRVDKSQISKAHTRLDIQKAI